MTREQINLEYGLRITEVNRRERQALGPFIATRDALIAPHEAAIAQAKGDYFRQTQGIREEIKTAKDAIHAEWAERLNELDASRAHATAGVES